MHIHKMDLGCVAQKGALGLFFSSLASMAFAWSISGTVSNEAGAPLEGVSISSFNYADVSGTTDAQGNFALSNEGTGIADFGLNAAKFDVQYQGSILNINNRTGEAFKVSLMDALGKVMFQQDFDAQNPSMQLDLRKTSHQKMMILRVSAAGSSSSYTLSKDGARKVLKKEGDPLAGFQFAKEGYDRASYTMSAEVETNVSIVLKVAGSNPTSSTSIITPITSSNSNVSSSSEPEVISCDGKTYQAGNHNMDVMVDGKKRTFIMHVPDSYKGSAPVPLVVDYHPVMGSGQGQLNGTTYKSLTDKEGVISLYPDGTKSADASKMGPGWNVGPCCSDDDDVKFSREMIKAVKEKVCIDNKRIYATGFSMGGGMSNHVACFMSDVYAAVAPAGMDLNTTNSAICKPDRPISIIMFRGTNDNVCRYTGGDSGFNDGLNFLGAEKNFKFWAEKNGCVGVPTTNSDGCQEYSSCNAGTKVVLCTKQGGGHEQGDGKIGWPFLKQFTMP